MITFYKANGSVIPDMFAINYIHIIQVLGSVYICGYVGILMNMNSLHSNNYLLVNLKAMPEIPGPNCIYLC